MVNPKTTQDSYALSLKQPWAALLASGLKTIEVRNWQTARRGRILIHAARIPDDRPEAWKQVPETLKATAALLGGIVGEAELTDCVRYASLEDFGRDQGKHLNDLAWFTGKTLHGFVFANPTLLPFRQFPGWMRFFAVPEATP